MPLMDLRNTLLWAGRKGPATYTRYFALGMQLSPALQSPFSFHLECGYAPKKIEKHKKEFSRVLSCHVAVSSE